ncbi:Uncharacterised protein [Anaerococcus prevotii]|uniref:Lipoprotein n=1 Tax=Anaerococcus prevotii (strain ATCC 9321 / DSM 20548 / JCM 6508 / NCTC 11806 / PC1) TaxID=525919 RepID=C7RF06_ANAPD|nr:hypothetical protein [Anaerococcus prevotii]ACV28067.1 hypothetical protein Apre_0012 [Anaerococcus prevotii DSM 20548]SUU93616.1 Uncharacterised protein [Anaerococcus prevotii]
MKKRNIILAFALILALSSCQNLEGSKKGNVSEKTIENALAEEKESNNNSDLIDDKDEDAESKDKKDDSSDKNVEDALANINYDDIRKYITDIGEFDPEVLDELTDDDIKEYYLRAKAASDKTGYWDVKDFFFQELAKDYREYSNKFPLDSIEDLYNWPKSTDKVTDKYADERKFIANLGYDQAEIDKMSDKKLEEAFKKAYDKNPEGLYNDYIESVGKNNFDKNENSTNDVKAQNSSQNVEKFSQNQSDYDEFKKSLVELYEFDPDVVAQMTNEDIDLAASRGQKILEETGYGDIGLIINELAKMYPGSSTMYPGE